jgi:hypothetical protein
VEIEIGRTKPGVTDDRRDDRCNERKNARNDAFALDPVAPK